MTRRIKIVLSVQLRRSPARQSSSSSSTSSSSYSFSLQMRRRMKIFLPVQPRRSPAQQAFQAESWPRWREEKGSKSKHLSLSRFLRLLLVVDWFCLSIKAFVLTFSFNFCLSIFLYLRFSRIVVSRLVRLLFFNLHLKFPTNFDWLFLPSLCYSNFPSIIPFQSYTRRRT